MFWIYNMPSALFALLTVLAVELFAVGGLLLVRRFFSRWLLLSKETNDTVGTFSLGLTALYSVAVGLIAVASWQNYATVGGLVSREASTIGVLYRDVAGYPEPLRDDLRRGLREYANFLIEKVWPAQQQGVLLDEPTAMLTTLHGQMLTYHPPDGGATAMHAETMRKFDEMVDLRRQRVDRVGEGLPAVLWIVVGVGALTTVSIRSFHWTEHVRLHVLLTALLALFVGLLVYLIAALDRPFRGSVSVSAQPYRLIVEKVMDRLDAAR